MFPYLCSTRRPMLCKAADLSRHTACMHAHQSSCGAASLCLGGITAGTYSTSKVVSCMHEVANEQKHGHVCKTKCSCMQKEPCAEPPPEACPACHPSNHVMRACKHAGCSKEQAAVLLRSACPAGAAPGFCEAARHPRGNQMGGPDLRTTHDNTACIGCLYTLTLLMG